jgi:hypothetical protein
MMSQYLLILIFNAADGLLFQGGRVVERWTQVGQSCSSRLEKTWHLARIKLFEATKERRIGRIGPSFCQEPKTPGSNLRNPSLNFETLLSLISAPMH